MKLSDPCVTNNTAHPALSEIVPFRLADRASEYEVLLLAASTRWTLGELLDAMAAGQEVEARAEGIVCQPRTEGFAAVVNQAHREGSLSLEVAALLLEHAIIYFERLRTRGDDAAVGGVRNQDWGHERAKLVS